MSASRKRLAGVLAIALVAWVGWRVFRLAVGSPRAALASSTWTESTRVYARDGRLLGERASSSGLHGRHTRLDAISARIVLTTIASEDRAFYRHDGIDRVALLRALVSDVVHWRIVSGGSTITAQLVKRIDHEGAPHARTIATKLVEMARAQNLEADLDKRTILEAYLDHIDYGHGYAGPEAAARGYFGVPASEVSLAQAAFLAVLPRAPSALDPYRHVERALVRQRALLQAMGTRGEIATDDLARALAEPIVIRPREGGVLVAPHLVLSMPRGAGDVHTTIDFDLQRDTEAIVRTHATALHARGAGNSAVIVIDNATGDVLAEVGSADYFDKATAGAVDLVNRKRQAGSTLKPFLYAHAFERGLSPMAPLADVPTDLGTTGAVYAPDNFDGTFVGPVSAREALAGSLNVPAVRLTAEMGAREAVSVLQKAGLELKDGSERYGLSIALGSAEVSPRELAGAYVMLARGGERIALRDRLKAGEVDEAASGDHVIAAASVALVVDALSDPLARVRGLHARGPFELPFPVALKTGTSTGYRDAWTAGFTRERTVVVWVGNASGAATNKVTGASGAGPLFSEVMRRAMVDVPARGALFDRSLLEEAEVCALSGDRPGDACTDRVERRFARGMSPTVTCKLHRHALTRAAPAGEPPFVCSEAGGDRTIVVLPDTFARFLGERAPGAPGMDPHGAKWFLASSVPGCSAGATTTLTSPGASAEGTFAELGPRVVLVQPHRGAVFHADEAPISADVVEVIATTEGLPEATPLEVLIDGKVTASLAPPYKGVVPITRGEHSVEVRPRDAKVLGRVARAEISVR